MEIIIPLLIALVAIALVWKLLAGIIKTVALVAIAVIAAVYIFGVGA